LGGNTNIGFSVPAPITLKKDLATSENAELANGFANLPDIRYNAKITY
jgi:hypothetical protein